MAEGLEEIPAPGDPETTAEEQEQGTSPSLLQAVFEDQTTLSCAGIFLSGAVLLAALLSDTDESVEGHRYWAYGIAVASVAMFFSLVGFFVRSNNQIAMYNNYFLFLWCFIGACFMTFGGPFKDTGNGK